MNGETKTVAKFVIYAQLNAIRALILFSPKDTRESFGRDSLEGVNVNIKSGRYEAANGKIAGVIYDGLFSVHPTYAEGKPEIGDVDTIPENIIIPYEYAKALAKEKGYEPKAIRAKYGAGSMPEKAGIMNIDGKYLPVTVEVIKGDKTTINRFTSEAGIFDKVWHDGGYAAYPYIDNVLPIMSAKNKQDLEEIYRQAGEDKAKGERDFYAPYNPKKEVRINSYTGLCDYYPYAPNRIVQACYIETIVKAYKAYKNTRDKFVVWNTFTFPEDARVYTNDLLMYPNSPGAGSNATFYALLMPYRW